MPGISIGRPARLIGLVNDIIRLSRLDEGGSIGTWETVDLYEMAGRIMEQLAPAAAKKHVVMERTGEKALARGGSPDCGGDPLQPLRQCGGLQPGGGGG